MGGEGPANRPQKCGIGAQFGGKYFALDVRVVRLPRHGASCPVGMGVSCSADRNIKAKITRDGIFLEQLEDHPGEFIPATSRTIKDEPIVRDRPEPPDGGNPGGAFQASGHHPCVALRPLVVARDIAHAKLKERVDAGQGLPQYFKDHAVYYAGPAKTPTGYASGSFGPTTAGRMDGYVDLFQSLGGSMVMLAKGNRSKAVTDACKKHGGFYLGSIGGPAAILAKENITQGRAARISRTRHGGRLEDRGPGFPRLHPRRRQGTRFLRRFLRDLHPVLTRT